MAKNYFPSNDSEFLTWFRNFLDKLKNNYAAELEVPGNVVSQLESDFNEAKSRLDELQAAKTKAQSATEAKNTAFGNIQNYMRDQVAIIKRHSKYTNTIGEDLGMIAPKPISKDNIPPGTKPSFLPTVMLDRVRLDWTKSFFSGVAIYGRRGSEQNFTLLARDTKSPYDDARPLLTPEQPESREYRMHYLLDDDEVGEWSDVVKVVCLF